jgi:hypothetical protein
LVCGNDDQGKLIGVGMAHWVVPPLPPNRTGGFPASGSPVGEYLHEAF